MCCQRTARGVSDRCTRMGKWTKNIVFLAETPVERFGSVTPCGACQVAGHRRCMRYSGIWKLLASTVRLEPLVSTIKVEKSCRICPETSWETRDRGPAGS